MIKKDEAAHDSSKTSCVALHVRKADRQVAQFYDRYLRSVGIRSTQYGLMRCIAGLTEPFISDIGRALSMDQTTVTRNIEKLEKMGLVKTGPYPDDPRKKRVVLSSKGRQKMEEARPYWQKAQDAIRAQMGDENLAHLLELLSQLSKATKA